MPSPSVVRRAIPEDSDEIWRLFLLLHAENAMLPIKPEKVDFYLKRFLNPSTIEPNDSGPRGILAVIGEVGKLEGLIMLMISGFWYSDTMLIEEALNFVDPQCRKSNHAKALISYARHIIDDLRCEYTDLKLLIGIISNKRTAGKIRLYSQFLEPSGCYFVYPKMDSTIADPLKRLYKSHHVNGENDDGKKARANQRAIA